MLESASELRSKSLCGHPGITLGRGFQALRNPYASESGSSSGWRRASQRIRLLQAPLGYVEQSQAQYLKMPRYSPFWRVATRVLSPLPPALAARHGTNGNARLRLQVW